MEKNLTRSPKSPLNNKGIRRSSRTREMENTSQALVISDNLHNQIHDILNTSGRRQLSRRRRNRRRNQSTSAKVSEITSSMNASTSKLNCSFHADISQQLNQSLNRSIAVEEEPKKEENPVLPPNDAQTNHPPPSPCPSTASDKSFTSCYSTSGKAPNRLLLRLEAKQKKYQALSTKLIEYERDLFETKTQLHDRIDEINELNETLRRKGKKISIQRQELVERCEELNNLKKRMDKELSDASSLRKTLEKKETMWRSNLMEVTKSNRKLLAQTIQTWEEKFSKKNEEIQRKDSELERIVTRMNQVEEEMCGLRKQLSDSQAKLDEKSGELGEKLGELVALRKEKIELEKSVLCLSKHIEKERTMRIMFEDRTKDYESLVESHKMKDEEIIRLEKQLSSLRELREKEASMVRRAMDRMTACGEMMKENLPHVLNRINMRQRKFDEDWNSLTQRSNNNLEDLKKKLDHYKSSDERETLPKETGTNDYINPFIQFCSTMYGVFKRLISKQQDVNSINNCYVQKMKEKEEAAKERVRNRNRRRRNPRMYLHQHMSCRV